MAGLKSARVGYPRWGEPTGLDVKTGPVSQPDLDWVVTIFRDLVRSCTTNASAKNLPC